jgi:hypothetical protein
MICSFEKMGHMKVSFSDQMINPQERLFRRIVLDLIKNRNFIKLIDNQLFESELIDLSIYPDTELFNGLMKRQSEFLTNIEDILIKKLNY